MHLKYNARFSKTDCNRWRRCKKIIEISVKNANTVSSAKKIAFSIANSPLVKTAIAGEDANWGRIVMAIGKSYEPINQNKIKIKFGKYLVTKNGMKYSKYSEKNLSEYLQKKEINISIDLGIGDHKWTVYTCDLTEQYIRINADYKVKSQIVSTIALVDDDDKILIGKRPLGKTFENLWEFPGGKVEKMRLQTSFSQRSKRRNQY